MALRFKHINIWRAPEPSILRKMARGVRDSVWKARKLPTFTFFLDLLIMALWANRQMRIILNVSLSWSLLGSSFINGNDESKGEEKENYQASFTPSLMALSSPNLTKNQSLNWLVTKKTRHLICSHYHVIGSHYICSHCKKYFTIIPKLSVPRLSVSIFVVTALTYYRFILYQVGGKQPNIRGRKGKLS